MKIKNQIVSFVTILAVALMTFSCTNDEPKEVTPLKSIVDIAKSDPANFSILIDALKKTGLEATLANSGSYTVFAPTNAAFTAAGVTSASINALTAPADATAISNLRLLLQNHVITSGIRADDLLAAGYTRTFAFYRSSPTAITGANLTMFINKIGNDVLINGGVANLGAKVTTANIEASNGILHVVDGVIFLPTIVNHLVANPAAFSTLLSVVNSTAGTFGDQTAIKNRLVNATNTTATPSLTVFAPSNAAFTTATATGGYLTGATVTPANITKILQYHVATGNLVSSSATSWTGSTATADATISTLATVPNLATFQTFKITLASVRLTELPALTVPASTLRTVNIQASNGVVHIQDRVLQPVLR